MAPKKSSSEKKQGSIRKIISAYKMTKEQDTKVGIICLAWALAAFIVVGAVFTFLLRPIAGAVVGIPSGFLVWLIIFGRRAEKAAYKRVEGQPGAAGAALGILRKGWRVQQAVAVTKSQDVVHRVLGRPGVVLVGEGNPNRVRNLLAVEKKKHARVVGETPIYDIAVTDDGVDGTIAVRKLAKHIQKLPRNIAPADVTDLLQRLKALDAMRPQVPVPKGPTPQTARQARQAMRGH
ncbi:MAG: DUF4191 domain-containing protein [Nocardioidaceae bacterium]